MTLVRICHILETSGGGSGQVVLALARHRYFPKVTT